MTKKIAINGFGRIGRLFFKQIFGEQGVEIVAINDLGSLENLAYLLKYDTVYGRWRGGEVSVRNGKLIVDPVRDNARAGRPAQAGAPERSPGGTVSNGASGKEIAFLQIKDPTQLPWRAMSIDIVVESTGLFEEYEKAKVHLTSGAKRVVITAPAKDPDGTEGKTVLVGVNDDEAKGVLLTSNGSCTTNAASPVIQIMSENPGIAKAILSTTHGYTATQSIVDGPAKGRDFRRGRAAAENIVPSTTGAAIAVTRAIKELQGKFDGISLRVPVVAGSIADVTFVAKRKTSVEEINDIFKKAAASPRWKGILGVVEDQVVSSDILGEPYGAIVDLNFTKVVDGDLVKVLSWYDNEAGYVSTLVRHVKMLASLDA